MRLNVSLQFDAMNSARESRKKADGGKKKKLAYIPRKTKTIKSM